MANWLRANLKTRAAKIYAKPR